MCKEKIKKATFDDFIAKKMQRDNDKMKLINIYVTSMNKTVTFKNPSEEKILELVDNLQDDKNSKIIINAIKKLIYDCCPLLQDTKLHEELNIIDPYDIVSEIFTLADINEIGEQLSQFIEPNKVIEKIKN